MKKIIYKILRKIYYLIPLSDDKRKELYRKRKKIYTSSDDILRVVQKYDVVSFDIFDTLVTRMIYNPDDIFILIGEKLKIKSFIEKRKQAEQLANKNLNKDVNLDEIYNAYQEINKIDNAKRKEIQLLEENIELEFIVPRLEVLELVKKIYNSNKKMIIVSDMYLNKKTILKMLKKCGYDINMFDNIYISNDINRRKDTEEVWPYIKKIYKRKNIIHLGDNVISDIELPKKYKISTIKITSSKELFTKSELYECLTHYVNNRTVSDSIYLGILINKMIYNSPFTNYNINTLKQLGYCFHAPILNEFLKFIVEKTKEKDNLLFLAREGYYLQKLYQEFCELYFIEQKENIYFLTSRKSTYTATIYNEKDIYNLIDKEFSGTFETFMDQIFDIKVSDKTKIQLPKDIKIINEKIKPYIKDILNTSINEREAYLKYISNVIKEYKDKELAVIDLGYSGTIQYNLTKLLKKEITGVYLTNSSTVKKYSKESVLLYCFDINNNENYKYIYYYSLILEFFLSAPFGQLQRFITEEKGVKPIYNNELLDSNKEKSLNEIYIGVKAYFIDVCKIEKIYNLNINYDLIANVYKNIVDKNIINEDVKDKFNLMDSFAASEVRNVFKIIDKY